MLTEEEADRIIYELHDYTTLNPSNLRKILFNCVEKPKPEIKLENIVKAIQVLSNTVGHLHTFDDKAHIRMFCPICQNFDLVDALLEGEE